MLLKTLSEVLKFYKRGVMSRREAVLHIKLLPPDVLRETIAGKIPEEWLSEIKDDCYNCRSKAARDGMLYIESICNGPNFDAEQYRRDRNERWWNGMRAWFEYFKIDYEDGVPQWK